MFKSFSKEYSILYHDLSRYNKTDVTTFFKFFQDIAVSQSNTLELGLDYYQKNNVTWILHKYNLEVNRFPEVGEKLNILTQPTAMDKFYGYRLFEVTDEKGKNVATAESIWLFINTKNMRPIRVNDDMLNGFMDGKPEGEGKVFSISDPTDIVNADNRISFPVLFSDIDMNNHVNNTKYIAWGLASLPDEFHKSHILRNIVVKYKKAAVQGDNLTSESQIIIGNDATNTLHKIKTETSDCCFLELRWKTL